MTLGRAYTGWTPGRGPPLWWADTVFCSLVSVPYAGSGR